MTAVRSDVGILAPAWGRLDGELACWLYRGGASTLYTFQNGWSEKPGVMWPASLLGQDDSPPPQARRRPPGQRRAVSDRDGYTRADLDRLLQRLDEPSSVRTRHRDH